MNRLISLALLGGGIVLVIFGLSASESIGSEFSRFFTGNPSDRSMWLLIGGGVAIIAGLFGFTRGSRSS